MPTIVLNSTEADFLTEPFPLALGDVFSLASGVIPKAQAIDMLNRFHELGFIKFRVWLFLKIGDRVEMISDHDNSFELKVNQSFWDKLEAEEEIWHRLGIGMERLWDIGIDLTDDFIAKYFEPDDTEFWKLINQE